MNKVNRSLKVYVDGSLVKEIQNKKGLTNKDLAIKVGCSIYTIHRIVRENKCNVKYLSPLAQSLGINLRVLEENKISKKIKNICFIDDDYTFEIQLFKDVFTSKAHIIAECSFEECLEIIGSNKNLRPDLFVLDLYYPKGKENKEDISQLKRSRPSFADDNGEHRQAYLNFLSANERLQSVLKAWKQTPEGGIEIAKKVCDDFPDTPIVFYSRKATLEDRIICRSLPGVMDVINKPSGKDDDDIKENTVEMRS